MTPIIPKYHHTYIHTFSFCEKHDMSNTSVFVIFSGFTFGHGPAMRRVGQTQKKIHNRVRQSVTSIYIVHTWPRGELHYVECSLYNVYTLYVHMKIFIITLLFTLCRAWIKYTIVIEL